MDLPDRDWGDFSFRRAVDSSSFFFINYTGNDYKTQWWLMFLQYFCWSISDDYYWALVSPSMFSVACDKAQHSAKSLSLSSLYQDNYHGLEKYINGIVKTCCNFIALCVSDNINNHSCNLFQAEFHSETDYIYFCIIFSFPNIEILQSFEILLKIRTFFILQSQ